MDEVFQGIQDAAWYVVALDKGLNARAEVVHRGAIIPAGAMRDQDKGSEVCFGMRGVISDERCNGEDWFGIWPGWLIGKELLCCL